MYSRRPRVIPVLLLSNNGIVKTIKFNKPTYLGDPINAVKIFNEKEVDELCILDIEASRMKKEPNIELLSRIASEAFMPISYGGGIKNIDQIIELFRIGFEKVVLNTSFIENPKLISHSANIVGSQSITVSIDAKKNLLGQYVVVTDNGRKMTKYSPFELAKKAEEYGAGEIIINSVDNDGTMKGYDDELVKGVVQAVGIPVTALGGAGSLDDIRKVINEDGAHAAAAGSLFVYFGSKKAVLLNFPTESQFEERQIYQR